ncbi:hypothetical protein V8E51_007293 [Hyaloscypha variabilis]
MRKHDEEYVEKIKLWIALCETEMGLRRLGRGFVLRGKGKLKIDSDIARGLGVSS